MKKTTQLTLLTLTLAMSSAAFADGPAPSAAEVSMLNQLKSLNTNVQVVGNRLQAAAEANARSKASTGGTNFNFDQSKAANVAAMEAKQSNAKLTAQNTLNDIIQQLQPLSDNLLQTKVNGVTDQSVAKRLQADLNQKTHLSLNLSASDSVYANDPSIVQLSSLFRDDLPDRGFAQPTSNQNRDNYLDFNSLIEPTAYAPNSDAVQAAQTFLTFMTAGYNNPGDQIDYQAFQSKLKQAGSNAKDKASLYAQLMNDDKYKAFQLSTRTLTAQRSVAVNNFQQMMAERTVLKGLGKQAGLVDANGKPVDDASALQVQKYIATHRVNDPNWFSKVQSASPAAVQRETLVVLAEMEAQNYQAHLDRERMIATLSAMAAQNSALTANMSAAQARDLNQDINNFTLPSQQSN